MRQKRRWLPRGLHPGESPGTIRRKSGCRASRRAVADRLIQTAQARRLPNGEAQPGHLEEIARTRLTAVSDFSRRHGVPAFHCFPRVSLSRDARFRACWNTEQENCRHRCLRSPVSLGISSGSDRPPVRDLTLMSAFFGRLQRYDMSRRADAYRHCFPVFRGPSRQHSCCPIAS